MATLAPDADRDTIAAEIARLMAKYRRFPLHWEARRLEVMGQIMTLVDRIILLDLEPE